MPSSMAAFAAALVLPWILAGSALAQAASYRDEDGRLHMVDRIEDVPARYRSDTSVPRASVAPPGPRVPGSVPEPRGSEAPSASPTAVDGVAEGCALELVSKPTRRQEGRDPKVTFEGEVRNSGLGRARGVQVTLVVHRAADGATLDEVTRPLRPIDLDPGAVGSFSVTADFEKLNNRDPGADEVHITMSRCERATAAERDAAPAPTCELALVGAVDKQADMGHDRVTARGEVVNRGTGRARGVDVHWRTYEMVSHALMEDHQVRLRPPDLGPGESGRFEQVIPLDFGKRDPGSDQIEPVAARCVAPGG